MMVTAAGTVKPAHGIVLGAGVAGLQAIATARRLGAKVSAYDVRPEVKEQVQSLGARFIELELGASRPQARARLRRVRSHPRRNGASSNSWQRCSRAGRWGDRHRALLPCLPAPVLITEEALKAMHEGAVIVDLAAASGGNCPLTEPDRITVQHGVIFCGITNFPALMPTEASQFFARNVMQFLLYLLGHTPPQAAGA